MKNFSKKITTLLKLFGIVLGIIIIINLVLPGLFPNVEGFQEGATTASKTTLTNRACIEASEKCEKSIREHITAKVEQSKKDKLTDKHFKNGDISKDFIEYAKDSKKKIDISKDKNCQGFAKCEFEKSSGAAPAPSPAPAPASSSSSTPGDNLITKEEAIEVIKKL